MSRRAGPRSHRTLCARRGMLRWPIATSLCVSFFWHSTLVEAPGQKKRFGRKSVLTVAMCRARITALLQMQALVCHGPGTQLRSGLGPLSNAGRYLLAGEALLKACAAAGRACRTGDLRYGGHPSLPRAPHSGTGPPTHAVRRDLEAATAQADRCCRASDPDAHAHRRFVAPRSRSDRRLPLQPPRATGPNCPQKRTTGGNPRSGPFPRNTSRATCLRRDVESPACCVGFVCLRLLGGRPGRCLVCVRNRSRSSFT